VRPGAAIWRLAQAAPAQAAAWALVVASFVVMSVLRGDGRVWPYLTVVLLCTAAVALVDRSVGFSVTALWLLVLTGSLHLAGGLVPTGDGVLYDTWLVSGVLRYDQAVHMVGSAAATVASWQLLGTWLDLSRTPARTQAYLAAVAGLGKGALNEVLEFLVAVRLPGQHVGGYENTGWDLVFDVAGCVAAAAFLVWSRSPRRPLRDARALTEESVVEVAP
jgi:putative membrane protein